MINYFAIPGITPRQNADIKDIGKVVCEVFGIDYQNWLDNTMSHKRKFAEPRHAFFYFVKKYTKKSLSQIGALLNKDHATVLNSIKNINNQLQVDKSFKAKFDAINERLAEKNKKD